MQIRSTVNGNPFTFSGVTPLQEGVLAGRLIAKIPLPTAPDSLTILWIPRVTPNTFIVAAAATIGGFTRDWGLQQFAYNGPPDLDTWLVKFRHLPDGEFFNITITL